MNLVPLFIGQAVKEIYSTKEGDTDFMTIELDTGVFIKFVLDDKVEIGIPEIPPAPEQLSLVTVN